MVSDEGRRDFLVSNDALRPRILPSMVDRVEIVDLSGLVLHTIVNKGGSQRSLRAVLSYMGDDNIITTRGVEEWINHYGKYVEEAKQQRDASSDGKSSHGTIDFLEEQRGKALTLQVYDFQGEPIN